MNGNIDPKTPAILFFGCWRDVGHFMFTHYGTQSPRFYTREKGLILWYDATPWGYIDGKLVTHAPEGVISFHQNKAHAGSSQQQIWNAIAWNDYSVDSRPGSNCAFLCNYDTTAELLLAHSKLAYPEIFSRFKYPLTFLP